MRNGILAIVIVVVALTGYAFMKPAAPAADTIKWMSWADMQEAQLKQPRKVFVDVYTDWCTWCKRMDGTTFANKDIANYINDNYYAVKLDAETRETIKFKGKEYSYVSQGYRGYNQFAAELLNGQLSYPTGVYLDEKLDIITLTPGYQDPKTFEVIINYINSGAYKNTDYDTYSSSFKGKVQ